MSTTVTDVREEGDRRRTRVGNAKVVYVVAASGEGKTFAGDYLQEFRGFRHVDGDNILKTCAVAPENEPLAVGFLTCYQEHATKRGEDGPDAAWRPYHAKLATQVLDAAAAAATHKIVLSHVSCRQAWREYVVAKLIEGGVSKENITFVHLKMSPEVKLRGYYYRTKEQAEGGGGKSATPLADKMRMLGWKGRSNDCKEATSEQEEMSMDEFIEFYKERNTTSGSHDPFQEFPSDYDVPVKVVDVSRRDMSVLDNIDEASGEGLAAGRRSRRDDGNALADREELSFEQIRDRVKAIGQKADEEFSSSGSMDMVMKISQRLASSSPS